MTEAEQKQLYDGVLESIGAPGCYASALGMTVDRLDRDGAEGHFTAARELCNPFGILHGGAFYTAMDQLTGMAVISAAGRAAVTLDSNVSYLKPVPMGERVICRAACVHMGGTVAVYEAKCYGEDGALRCAGVFHYFLTKPLEKPEK